MSKRTPAQIAREQLDEYYIMRQHAEDQVLFFERSCSSRRQFTPTVSRHCQRLHAMAADCADRLEDVTAYISTFPSPQREILQLMTLPPRTKRLHLSETAEALHYSEGYIATLAAPAHKLLADYIQSLPSVYRAFER